MINKLEYQFARYTGIFCDVVGLTSLAYFGLQQDWTTAGIACVGFILVGKLFKRRANKFKNK